MPQLFLPCVDFSKTYFFIKKGGSPPFLYLIGNIMSNFFDLIVFFLAVFYLPKLFARFFLFRQINYTFFASKLQQRTAFKAVLGFHFFAFIDLFFY